MEAETISVTEGLRAVGGSQLNNKGQPIQSTDEMTEAKLDDHDTYDKANGSEELNVELSETNETINADPMQKSEGNDSSEWEMNEENDTREPNTSEENHGDELRAFEQSAFASNSASSETASSKSPQDYLSQISEEVVELQESRTSRAQFAATKDTITVEVEASASNDGLPSETTEYPSAPQVVIKVTNSHGIVAHNVDDILGVEAAASAEAAADQLPSSDSAETVPSSASAGAAPPAQPRRRRAYRSAAQRLRENSRRWARALRRDKQLLLSQQPTAAQAVRCHLFLEVLPSIGEPADPMSPAERNRVDNLLHDNVQIYRNQ